MTRRVHISRVYIQLLNKVLSLRLSNSPLIEIHIMLLHVDSTSLINRANSCLTCIAITPDLPKWIDPQKPSRNIQYIIYTRTKDRSGAVHIITYTVISKMKSMGRHACIIEFLSFNIFTCILPFMITIFPSHIIIVRVYRYINRYLF